ncbi:MAG: PAS domain S-box protein, partial [Acidobacteriia bacterium]|nr:PAS domain S-box protein [Terriglobia bacterium]
MLPKKTEGAGKLPSGLLDQEIEERTDVNSLRRMIEMLPQIAFVGTRDGSAVYFNQYWHNYAGISRDAAGVDLWTPAIHPDDLDRSLAEWRRAAETGREHSGEYRVHRAADGQFRWHQVHSVPVKDPSGQITAWLSTALDVHQQKTAEEELRESEARLRAILHAEPECVKTLSLQGLIVEINPAGLAMIEADSAQQLLGKPIFDVVCEPYRASMERLYKSVLAGQTGNLDFEIIGLKGTRRYLRTHATPLRDHSGTIVSMLSISQDITERKKAEDALRDNEARFRALIENSSSVILLFDSAWNVIYSSTPRHPILGYNAEEARKVKVLDLCHPDDRSSLYEAGKKCVKNPGVPVVATVRLRGKDG